MKNVVCLNSDSFWVCGDDDIMKFFNVEKDSFFKLIKILFGNILVFIIVILIGEFVFIDYMDKIVNIVKNEKIEIVIRLNSWILRGVCGIFFGDFLVIMVSEDRK